MEDFSMGKKGPNKEYLKMEVEGEDEIKNNENAGICPEGKKNCMNCQITDCPEEET